jgi:hypothetical protein
MEKKKTRYKPERTNLLNMLNEKSLEAIRHFGHVYEGPNSGKRYLRIYKNNHGNGNTSPSRGN